MHLPELPAPARALPRGRAGTCFPFLTSCRLLDAAKSREPKQPVGGCPTEEVQLSQSRIITHTHHTAACRLLYSACLACCLPRCRRRRCPSDATRRDATRTQGLIPRVSRAGRGAYSVAQRSARRMVRGASGQASHFIHSHSHWPRHCSFLECGAEAGALRCGALYLAAFELKQRNFQCNVLNSVTFDAAHPTT